MTPSNEIYRLVHKERCSRGEIGEFFGMTDTAVTKVIAVATREQYIARHPDVEVLATWAAQYRHVTWQMVAEQFKVSRATAYRMLTALRAFNRRQL